MRATRAGFIARTATRVHVALRRQRAWPHISYMDIDADIKWAEACASYCKGRSYECFDASMQDKAHQLAAGTVAFLLNPLGACVAIRRGSPRATLACIGVGSLLHAIAYSKGADAERHQYSWAEFAGQQTEFATFAKQASALKTHGITQAGYAAWYSEGPMERHYIAV